jgi:hypothetical protein
MRISNEALLRTHTHTHTPQHREVKDNTSCQLEMHSTMAGKQEQKNREEGGGNEEGSKSKFPKKYRNERPGDL